MPCAFQITIQSFTRSSVFAMAARYKWTNNEIVFLIDDVERHKGRGGSYMTERPQAIREIQRNFNQKFPSNFKTTTQIRKKLCNLDERCQDHGKRIKNNLYLQGWAGLKVSRESLLADGEAKHGQPSVPKSTGQKGSCVGARTSSKVSPLTRSAVAK